ILSTYNGRILDPGATESGAHVDYPYWAMRSYAPRPPLMMQVIWMMQDFTEDNGATRIVPGSQRRCQWPDREGFESECVKVTGKAGTAVLSHGLLWHDTGRNNTGNPRVAILINYTLKVIRPLYPELPQLPPEVLERATPKLRQLLGFDLDDAMTRALQRNYANAK